MRTLALGLAIVLAAAGPSAPVRAQTGGTARVRTRSYFFVEAGRSSDYKLFVSSRYRQGVPAPLIVALHPFATAGLVAAGDDALLQGHEPPLP